MLTVTLRNGVTVLGKMHKGDLHALHYGNRTQATRKAAEIGGAVYHWDGPCFYVAPTAPVVGSPTPEPCLDCGCPVPDPTLPCAHCYEDWTTPKAGCPTQEA